MRKTRRILAWICALDMLFGNVPLDSFVAMAEAPAVQVEEAGDSYVSDSAVIAAANRSEAPAQPAEAPAKDTAGDAAAVKDTAGETASMNNDEASSSAAADLQHAVQPVVEVIDNPMDLRETADIRVGEKKSVTLNTTLTLSVTSGSWYYVNVDAPVSVTREGGSEKTTELPIGGECSFTFEAKAAQYELSFNGDGAGVFQVEVLDLQDYMKQSAAPSQAAETQPATDVQAVVASVLAEQNDTADVPAADEAEEVSSEEASGDSAAAEQPLTDEAADHADDAADDAADDTADDTAEDAAVSDEAQDEVADEAADRPADDAEIPQQADDAADADTDTDPQTTDTQDTDAEGTAAPEAKSAQNEVSISENTDSKISEDKEMVTDVPAADGQDAEQAAEALTDAKAVEETAEEKKEDTVEESDTDSDTYNMEETPSAEDRKEDENAVTEPASEASEETAEDETPGADDETADPSAETDEKTEVGNSTEETEPTEETIQTVDQTEETAEEPVTQDGEETLAPETVEDAEQLIGEPTEEASEDATSEDGENEPTEEATEDATIEDGEIEATEEASEDATTEDGETVPTEEATEDAITEDGETVPTEEVTEDATTEDGETEATEEVTEDATTEDGEIEATEEASEDATTEDGETEPTEEVTEDATTEDGEIEATEETTEDATTEDGDTEPTKEDTADVTTEDGEIEATEEATVDATTEDGEIEPTEETTEDATTEDGETETRRSSAYEKSVGRETDLIRLSEIIGSDYAIQSVVSDDPTFVEPFDQAGDYALIVKGYFDEIVIHVTMEDGTELPVILRNPRPVEVIEVSAEQVLVEEADVTAAAQSLNIVEETTDETVTDEFENEYIQYSKTGFIGLNISASGVYEPDNSTLYKVPVTLNKDLIENEKAQDITVAAELYKIVDGAAVKVDSAEINLTDGVLNGFTFTDTDFGTYMLTYALSYRVQIPEGYVYTFSGVNDVVWMSDLLKEVKPELTEKNYTFSISDKSLVEIAESGKNISYNGHSIAKEQRLTALDYFNKVILTLTAKNGKQVVEIKLKNPAPIVNPVEVEVNPQDVVIGSADVTDAAAALGVENAETEQTAVDEDGNEYTVLTKSGYIGLDISLDDAVLTDNGLYSVPVTLPEPLVLTGEEGKVPDNHVFKLYHIVYGEPKQVENVSFNYNDGILYGFTFETDSFSPYMVTYTVEFHNGEEEVVIAGGSQILLSTLIEKLGLTRENGDAFTVDEVESVTFADEELFTVEEVFEGDEVTLNADTNAAETVTTPTEHDFVITSKKAFAATGMVLTLVDGEVVTVEVTDANYTATIHYVESDGTDATSVSMTANTYYVYVSGNGNNRYSSQTLSGSQDEQLTLTVDDWLKPTKGGLATGYNPGWGMQYTPIEEGGVVGDYLFDSIQIDTENHTVAITLKKRASFTVNVEFYNSDGITKKTDASLSNYYLLADSNYYGHVTGNAVKISLTGADNTTKDTFYEGTSFSFVRYEANQWNPATLQNLNNQTKLTDGATVDVYTLSIPSEATDGVLTIRLTEQAEHTANIYFFDVDENPDNNPDLSDGNYYLLAKSGDRYLGYAPITGYGTISDWKDTTNVSMVLRKVDSFEIVKWANSNANFNNLQYQTKITDSGTIGKYYTVEFPNDYNPSDNNYVINAFKQEEHTAELQYIDAQGSEVATGNWSDSERHYLVLAYVNGVKSFYANINTSSGELTFYDVNNPGTPVDSLPEISDFKFVWKRSNNYNNIQDGNDRIVTTLPGTNGKYALSVGSPDGNTYKIYASEITTFPVSINFYDTDGETAKAPGGTFSGYKMYVGISTGDGRYWYNQNLDAPDMTNATNTKEYASSTNPLSLSNSNPLPGTATFGAGKDVTVAFNIGLAVQNQNNGALSSGSDMANGTVIFDSANNAYVVTREDIVNNGYLLGVTYKAVLLEPYSYSITKGDAGPVDFDSNYENKWYMLSTLTKPNGSVYYRVVPVTPEGLDGGPAGSPITGDISVYYGAPSTKLNEVKVGSEDNYSGVHKSAYETGDTVENKLVFVSNGSDTIDYRTVIRADGYGSATGDPVNKYIVTADNPSTDGEGEIVITKLPEFQIKTNFIDKNGSNVAEGDQPIDYWLLIKMTDDRGDEYVALQQVQNHNGLTDRYPGGGIKFQKINSNSLSGDNDLYYYTGKESVTTQLVIPKSGNPSLTYVLAKGTDTSVNYYNVNTADGSAGHDLSRDLYTHTSSAIVTETHGAQNENKSYVMTTVFQKNPDTGVDHKITVNFHNGHTDSSTPWTETNLNTNPSLNADTDGAYFLRVRLYNEGRLVAMKIVSVPASAIQTANSSGTFTVTIPGTGDDSWFQLVDDKGLNIDGGKLHYDPTVYTSDVRLYIANNAGDIPANLQEVSSKGYDTIDGFDFWYNQYYTTPATVAEGAYPTETGHYLGLYSENKKIYQVQLVIDGENVSVTADDNLDLSVSAEHKTTGTDTFLVDNVPGTSTQGTYTDARSASPTTANADGRTVITYKIQDQASDYSFIQQYWTTIGNTGNTITGNETFTLSLSQNGVSLPEGYTVKIGDKYYTVKYDTGDKENVNITYDDEHGATIITHHAYLTTATYDKAIDPYDVLGEGAEFGVVANKYIRHDHTETNFATNTYVEDTSAGIDVDAAGGGEIPFYIGSLQPESSQYGVHFASTNTSYPDMYTPVSGKTSPYIHTAEEEVNDGIHQDSYGYDVTVMPTSKSDVETYVNGLIQTLKTNSAKYAAKPNQITPSGTYTVKYYEGDEEKTAGGYAIDTTMFPDDVTIYVDASEMTDKIATTGWTIAKLPGQSIVFNIPGQSVVVDKEIVDVYDYDEDGKLTKLRSVDANTGGNGGNAAHNANVENDILNHIVFNAYEATDLKVNSGPAGIFLAPNRNAYVHENSGSGTGWIATGGTFDQVSSEWHFFRTQRRYQRKDTTEHFQASKFMGRTTGDNETTLQTPNKNQVFDFVMEHLDWNTGLWLQDYNFRQKNSGSTINFPELSYSIAEEGTHYYRIRELYSGSSAQYAPDERQFFVKIDVDATVTGNHTASSSSTGYTNVNQLNGYDITETKTYYVLDPDTLPDDFKESSLYTDNEEQTVHQTRTVTMKDGTTQTEPLTDTTTVIRHGVDVSKLTAATDKNGNAATSSSDSADVIRFVNRYIGKYCVAITKNWDDENDRDGVRPDAIKVELWRYVQTGTTDSQPVYTWEKVTGIAPENQYEYTFDDDEDSETYGETTTYVDYALLNKANNWTHMVKGVDKYDSYGNVIKYQWRETAFVFGNTEIPVPQTAYENPLNLNPDVTITYYMSEDGTTFSVTQSTATPIAVTYTGKVTHTDTKLAFPDEDSVTYVTGLTNKHETLTTEAQATKKWKDSEGNKIDADNIPEGTRLTFRLIGTYTVDVLNENGNVTGTKTYEVQDLAKRDIVLDGTMDTGLTATSTVDGEYSAWVATWKNLPKYYDGHQITYKVVEIVVPAGYSSSNSTVETAVTCEYDTNDSIWKAEITNTEELGALQLTKTMFVDNENVSTSTTLANAATYKATEFFYTITTVINNGTADEVWYINNANTPVLTNSGSADLDAFLALINSDSSDKITDAIHTIKPSDAVTAHRFTGLPFGEYTIAEYVKTETENGGTTTTTYAAVTADNGDINSMKFIYDISKVTDAVTVDTVYNASDDTTIAEGELINAYTTGAYCIAVTKQWLTNGQVRVDDDDLELIVRLERTTTPDDDDSWEPAPLNLRITETDYNEDAAGNGTIKLTKDNNWSAVAVGMDKMDAEGNLYSYRWVELNGNTVVGVEGVIGNYAVGTSETLQRKDITVDDNGTEDTEDDEIVSMIFLTKLVNSNVEVEIPVQKLVNSETDTLFNLNTEFTVGIAKATQVNNTTVEQPDKDNVTSTLEQPTEITLHKNDKGQFVVSNITKAGVYTFEIVETAPAAADQIPGMSYDTEKKIVEVSVVWHVDNATDKNKLYLEVEYIRWINESKLKVDEPEWKYLEYHGDDEVTEDTEVDVVNVYELCELKVTKTVTLDDGEPDSTLSGKTFFVSLKDEAGNYYSTTGEIVNSVDRWIEVKHGQTVTWRNLPAGEYTVEENAAEAAQTGYTFTGVTFAPTQPVTITTASKDDAAVTVTATNAYTTLKTMAEVVKAWNDSTNQDGKRPTTVTMKLYANNEDTGIRVVLSDTAASQSYTAGSNTTYNTASGNVATALTGIVYNLPAYVNGVEQTYTWIEDQAALVALGYTIKSIVLADEDATYTDSTVDPAVTYTGDKATITNTYTPGKFCLTVLKVWDDQGNKYNKRPDSIKVQLYKQIGSAAPVQVTDIKIDAGTAANANAPTAANNWTITLNDGNNWSAMVLGVDKFEDGQEVKYFWKEVTDLTNTGYTQVTTGATKIGDDYYIPANEGTTRVGSVENTLDTGKLIIKKTVIGAPADEDLSRIKFTVTGPNDFSEVIYLAQFNRTGTDVNATYTYTFDYLPLGTYSVTEETGTAVIDSYHMVTTGETASVTTGEATIAKDNESTDSKENEQTVELKNIYEHDTGDLSINKTVQNPIGNDPDKEFTFTVELKDAKLNGVSGTFKGQIVTTTVTDGGTTTTEGAETDYVFGSNGKNTTEIKLKHNQTLKIKGLPTGVTYTVTEATETDYDRIAKENDTGAIVKDETKIVKFTNTRKTGGLTVTKTVVSSDANDNDKEFTVEIALKIEGVDFTANDISVTRNNEAIVDADLTKAAGKITISKVKHGDTIVMTGLPVGVAYTVTETSAAGFTVTYNGTTSEDPATGVIAVAMSTAAIYNTKDEGALAITKEIDSPAAMDQNKVFRFKVTLKNGDSAVEGTFTGILNTTINGTARTYTRDVTFDSNGEALVDLNPGDIMTISGIPAGYVYTVEEVEDKDHGFDLTGFETTYLTTGETEQTKARKTDDITIVKNTTTEINTKTTTFTNTRQTTNLVIDKTVVSAVQADHDKDYSFVVRMNAGTQLAIGKYKVDYYDSKTQTDPTTEDSEIQFVDGEATIQVHGDGKAVIKGVPVGATIRVTEIPDPMLSATRVNESGNEIVLLDGEDGSEVLTKDGLTVYFKNERGTGELDVTKTVSSDEAGDKDREYTFTVTFNAVLESFKAQKTGEESATVKSPTQTDATAGTSTWTFTLKDTQTMAITDLPVGVTYTVAETAVDGMTQTWSGKTGTISSTRSEAKCTNTRTESGLIVSKTVVSELKRDHEKEFNFTLTLYRVKTNEDGEYIQGTEPMAEETFADAVIKRGEGIETEEVKALKTDGNGQYPFTLTDGQIMVIQHLPEGAYYTVTEEEETADPADFTVEKIGDEGIIRKNGANLAEFVNIRKPGMLKLTKVVDSPLDVDQARVFEFNVQLYEDNADGTKDYLNATIAGREFKGEAGATFYVKAGQTLLIEGLPADVKYIVTEKMDDIQTARFEITGQDNCTGQIVPGDPTNEADVAAAPNAKITNTRKTADFLLKKTVVSPIPDDQKHEFQYTIAFNRDLGGDTGKAFEAVVNEGGFVDGKDYDANSGFNSGYAVTFTNGRAEVTMTGGTVLTIKGIPTEMTYTVFETPDNDFEPDFPDGTTKPMQRTGKVGQTDADGNVIPAAYINTRKTGELDISKKVDSPIGADKEAEYKFTVTFDAVLTGIKVQKTGWDEAVSVTAPDLVVDTSKSTYSFKLKHDEKLAITGLPTGVTYTVTEETPTGMAVVKTGDTGTIKADNSATTSLNEGISTADFTNTRQNGGLIISKAVVSDVEADKDIAFSFDITLDDRTVTGQYGDLYFENGVGGYQVDGEEEDTKEFKPGFTLKHGEKVTVSGLPIGVQYTVTESLTVDQAKIFDKMPIEAIIDKIEQNVTAAAAFTNTRKTGELEISKTVVSDNPADLGQSFTFTVALSVGDQKLAGTYSGVTFDENGEATIQLRDNESVTLTGLPVGAAWKVIETKVEGYTTTSNPTGNDVTDDSDNVIGFGIAGEISINKSTAAFTNTRDIGDLKIEKTVTSSLDADKNAEYTFTIYLDADIHNYDTDGTTDLGYTVTGNAVDSEGNAVSIIQFVNGVATLILKAANGAPTATITGLPTGVHYTVVETAPDGMTVSYEGDTGTIAKKGTTVTITNTRDLGHLEIDKKIIVDNEDKSNEDTYKDKSFYVKVQGVIDGTTYWVTSDNGTLSKTASEAKVFEVKPGTTLIIGKDREDKDTLPVGEYTVTEVKSNGSEITAQPDTDMGAMTYLKTLSRTEDKVTVIKGGTAKASMLNAYTTGKFCVAVTKQWLVNGEPYVDKDLSLTVKLQSSTDGVTWTDVTGQTGITLNKDNNWSYVAIGMEQMDEDGVRYDYQWVETPVTGWAEGTKQIIQKVNLPEGASDADAEATLIVLTKLNNSKAVAQPEVEKEVIGNTEAESYNADEEFEFTLKDAEGTEIQTGKIKAGETLTFNEITYTEAGTYTYTITETAGETEGMTYDSDAKTVTVEVEEAEETGALTAKVTYGDDDDESLTVTNVYAITTAQPEVEKEVIGNTEAESYNADEEFEFTLKDAEG
ncbi:MAG: Cna B-type domain-containing protein, partial [Clostridia bacterium]|nr:Cna B-type domain-containing protein [Clostridia bacterium]